MRRIGYTLLLSVLLLALAVGLLATTAGGSRWLLRNALQAGNAEASQIDGTLWQGVQIKGLQWRRDDLAFAADSLRFRWRPVELLGGRLRLTSLEGSGIRVTLPPSPPSSEPPGFDLALPIWVAIDHLLVTSLQVHSGSDQYLIDRIEGALHLDDQALHVDLAALEGYGGTLRGSARLTLSRPNALQADLDWRGALPDLGAIHAAATLGGDLTTPEIDARLKQPFPFSVRGRVDLTGAGLRLDLGGDWSEARWPLQGTPEVESSEGRYHLTGPLDAYRVEVEGRLTAWRLKETPLRLDGQGDTTALKRLTLDGELLGGRVEARGQVQWSPVPTWKVDLSAHGLDPATLDPGWPGTLDLEAATQGGMENDGVHLDVRIDRLEGRLRGYPLTGSGAFAMAGDRYRFESVHLKSGANRLDLSGRIADMLDLDLALDAPQLAALLPDLSGSARGKGHVGGSLVRPEVTLEAKLARLRYREMAAESGELQLDWRKKGGRGELHLTGATLAGIPHQELSLRLDGSPERHTLALTSHSPQLDLNAGAEGSWRAPRWRGALKRLDLHHPKAGEWRLRQPAAVALGTDRFSAERLCLQQKQAALCAAGGLQGEKLAGKLEIIRLPLALLTPWLPRGYGAEGKADGRATLGGTLNQPTLQGELKLPKGRLTLSAEGKHAHHISLTDGRVDLDYQQDRLKLKAHTAIESSGALQATLEAGPEQAGTRPLQGRIQLVFTDLTPFRTLLPQIEGLKGRVHSDFRIAGDSRRPHLSGELRLQEGGAHIPPLGITLREVQMGLRSTGTNRIAIEGHARSGEGTLEAQGELLLDPAHKWPLTLQIKGSDVTFLQRSEVFATASPDLRLERIDGRTTLKGRLHVPKAEITLDTLPEGAVNVSADEVIVDAAEQPDTMPKAADTGLPLEGRVRVTLGDEVRFKGLGLATRLKGDVELRISPKGTTAFGELALVEGRYRAYGQDLGIDRGRLLFTGPLDNPGLTIRAVRPSNDGLVTAVVRISGTAQAPQTQVFTEPPTSSDEALSYLLTGEPIDRLGEGDKDALREKAIGYGLEKLAPVFSALGSTVGLDELKLSSDAVTIGKRLSPKLYVGYLVDLFDSEGIWLLRYQINRFLQLETRSGKQKSVDLLYSYERD